MLTPHQAKYIAHDLTAQHGGGALPVGWPQVESETVELKTSLADLRRGKVSHRRNPLIADLFRRIGMLEAWGRGMPLILGNAPTVEFREIARLFIASFERPSAAIKTTRETSKPTKETTKEKTSERPVRMNEKLLRLIQQQPEITAAALSVATGTGVDGVNYLLNQLKQTGKLHRVGSTKSGRWEATAPDPKGKT